MFAAQPASCDSPVLSMVDTVFVRVALMAHFLMARTPMGLFQCWVQPVARPRHEPQQMPAAAHFDGTGNAKVEPWPPGWDGESGIRARWGACGVGRHDRHGDKGVP